MFARDRANCPRRQTSIGRSNGRLDTITGGAPIAASTVSAQLPRGTAIVDVATTSVSAISRLSGVTGFSPGPTTPAAWRSRSVEDRIGVPGALELVEAGRAGDQQHAVP